MISVFGRRMRRSGGSTRLAALLGIAAALTLAGILAWPGVRQMRDAARLERARQDGSAVAGALVRFYRDNGFFPRWDVAGAGSTHRLAPVDLLVSDGVAPAAPAHSLWSSDRVGRLSDELVTNKPSYLVRDDPESMGWAGPYLPDPPGPDPWGRRYVVNIGLMASADAPPDRPGTAKYAVWVLSAGPDGVIETPYAQLIADASLAGDDIGVRIQ